MDVEGDSNAMETQTVSPLFSGNPAPFGGLSNEKELAESCPERFRRESDWSDYAARLLFGGDSGADWSWKFDDKTVRQRQLVCFRCLLDSFDLPHEDKVAVAAWMLSEMLSVVPGKKN